MYHVNENAGWEGQSRKLCFVLALSLKEVSPFQFSDAPVIHQTAPQEVSMSITESGKSPGLYVRIPTFWTQLYLLIHVDCHGTSEASINSP